MDSSHVALGSIGLFVGWWFRAVAWSAEDPKPCACACNCAYSPVISETSSSSGFGNYPVILAILLGALGLIANLAVAFKVSWVSRMTRGSCPLSSLTKRALGNRRVSLAQPRVFKSLVDENEFVTAR
jgi:hypothetical protein